MQRTANSMSKLPRYANNKTIEQVTPRNQPVQGRKLSKPDANSTPSKPSGCAEETRMVHIRTSYKALQRPSKILEVILSTSPPGCKQPRARWITAAESSSSPAALRVLPASQTLAQMSPDRSICSQGVRYPQRLPQSRASETPVAALPRHSLGI